MAALKMTKTAQFESAWRDAVRFDDRMAELDAYYTWADSVKGKRFSATVLWFDQNTGEGGVKIEGHGRWQLFACNIKGKKTWYESTACVYHEVGQVIEVEIIPFSAGSLIVSHTQGTFDQEKWDSLNQDKLAFKCNDEGTPINGILG